MAATKLPPAATADSARLAWRPVERGARRAQHEPGDDVGVAAPQQLGDRAAHRVPGRDAAADAQFAEERRDVVGAVLEPERRRGAQPASVAAVVEGDDPEVVRQRTEARQPVQRGGRGPPVQQHHGGRASGPGCSRTNVRPRDGSSTNRPAGTRDTPPTFTLPLIGRPPPTASARRRRSPASNRARYVAILEVERPPFPSRTARRPASWP